MVLIHVNDDGQFAEALGRANKITLVVCDFFAHWCGPCRFIAPIFEQLAEKYNTALFLKIDVDRCRMTSQSYQVSAMPTFILLINNREVDRLRGADAQALEQLIFQHLPAAPSRHSANAATPEERTWLSELVDANRRMAVYEDEISQTLALSLIPLDDLRAKSRSTEGTGEKLSSSPPVDEFLLAKNLLNWFHDFFYWVNTAECEGCGVRCDKATLRQGSPTPDEQSDGASRVEVYECGECKQSVRFPRYNNPARLLETRKGRCGEWANCFALCCRASGLETRWVTDKMDHVWVEIYSTRLGRWIHCDPCENVIDTPLLYSIGWKKKYAYVFAVGLDHVRDVTWRYTLNHRQVLKRRTACREAVLRNFLNKLNKRLSETQLPERRQQLTDAYLKELIEFISPKCQLRMNSHAQEQGRQSGDAAWRNTRGELRESPSMGHSTSSKVQSVAIKPTQEEIKAGLFESMKHSIYLRLRYNCVKDRYSRPKDSSAGMTAGWEKLATMAEGVFRKVEHDWRKCYICRKPSVPKGAICWRVNLSGVRAKKIEIDLGRLETFKSGQILATACCGDICSRITDALTIDVTGGEYLELRVEFMGGEGECAWQHSQLFRSDMSAQATDNMTIKIWFDSDIAKKPNCA